MRLFDFLFDFFVFLLFLPPLDGVLVTDVGGIQDAFDEIVIGVRLLLPNIEFVLQFLIKFD